MLGRFIIDTYRGNPHAIYVYLRQHEAEDIVEQEVILDRGIDELVAADFDGEGRILGVEIILPEEKRHER